MYTQVYVLWRKSVRVITIYLSLFFRRVSVSVPASQRRLHYQLHFFLGVLCVVPSLKKKNLVIIINRGLYCMFAVKLHAWCTVSIEVCTFNYSVFIMLMLLRILFFSFYLKNPNIFVFRISGMLLFSKKAAFHLCKRIRRFAVHSTKELGSQKKVKRKGLSPLFL